MITTFINAQLLVTTLLTSLFTLSIVLFLLNKSKKNIDKTLTQLTTSFAASLGIPMSELGMKNKVKGEISGGKKQVEAIARDNLNLFFESWKSKNSSLVLGSSLLQTFNITEKDLLSYIQIQINKKPMQFERYLLHDIRTGGGLISTLMGMSKENVTPPSENPTLEPSAQPDISSLINLVNKNRTI